MAQKIKKIVFPVAGLATRFLPATKTVPKELFPLVDKPLLQYAVEEALEAGFEEFIFVSSHRKSAIEKHFARMPELEHYLEGLGKGSFAKLLRECSLPESAVKIVYQDEPLGLGHAVYVAQGVVGPRPFAVLLPDDAILCKGRGVLKQMVDFAEAEPGCSLIAAQDVAPEQVSLYGVVDGVQEKGHLRVKSLMEKPPRDKAPSNTAIIGRYVLQPEIFPILDSMCATRIDKKEIQLTDAISRLAKSQPVYGFQFEGQRFDCGQCAGFIEASVAYALERPDLAPALREKLARILKQ
ncbi:MAG: UTP--glucose-1-phosphate uridylyltransferase [Alphaproteobacteria bacterium]